MKAADVKIGSVYIVKVSGKLQPVRITQERPGGGWRGMNVNTGRVIDFRSAGRLRYAIYNPAGGIGT